MAGGGGENNPNFPSDLDIKPSSAPEVALSSNVGAPDLVSIDERFSTRAQEHTIREYGIAGRVWEASYAILVYLDRSAGSDDEVEFDPPPFTSGPRSGGSQLTIVELGSGTGLVAARLAKYVVLRRDLIIATDLPDVCPLLEHNLCVSSSDTILVRPLAWGSQDHALQLTRDFGHESASRSDSCTGARHLTHIICSDLVYFPALLAPLLRTLLQLTAPPFAPPGGDSVPAQLVISYKIRSLPKETPFWSAFGLWFRFDAVLARPKTDVSEPHSAWSRFVPVPSDQETYVLVAYRRPESLAWTVPEDDQELLAGVGAWGTLVGKTDDKFEEMLLLNISFSDEE
ncbi:hypothetical protein CERSUDRAFT_159157 [Gelatoporia subvermispora B]|uniref:Uncharacterized protein n=1 Tax=Ceriporiopsis subvermispora (strain B) TaxID=914234 RepID=M2QAD4_CERS8|nr:hypothetical protein CERSUDRAFT_159157 [Gelatoporia subvermispora B]